jgi:hypothetical protein
MNSNACSTDHVSLGAESRDRGRPHHLSPPPPPYIRIPTTAVRSLQHACARPGVDDVAPHGSLTPGRAPCRASDPRLACMTVQAFPTSPQVLCPLLTPPLGSESITPLSATCRGTPLSEAPGRPPVFSGHTIRAETPDLYSTAHCGWRTSRSRARSSRLYHTWYPVRVPRPARSFYAAFGCPLAKTSLRFPCPSAPRIPGQETCTPEHDRMHGTHATHQARLAMLVEKGINGLDTSCPVAGLFIAK